MAAATPLPVPAGLPSPRSPTLSDADFILPENTLRSLSPSPYIERPPSPPTLYSHSNRSAHTIKLASAPQGRRSASSSIKSPPLSTQSSRSTLRNMSDSDANAKRSLLRDDALASSPTIQAALSSHPTNDWNGHQQRRYSNASSSVHSEDLENMRWPGFDSHNGFEDSGVVLEEEERDQFPADANGEDDMDNEKWLTGQSDSDDDLYGSAALSRRAEIILANAKKRLNVMEGNLRGARQSLVVSPTFNTMKMASELSHQLAAARERDRRLYAGIGPIPPRTQPYRSSPLSTNGSPGHSRGLSETSVPLPFSPTYMSRALPNKRASSAMGVGSGPWSPEGYGTGRFPIRESRSFEVMRDPRNGWGYEERDHSLGSHSRGSKSPPNALETLPEDDTPKLHRSASTTSDLRGQMADLKGRISNLKQRAKEDSLRRRSLQSLRTPSPFTSAEIWYSGAEAYKTGNSPVTADAGVGVKMESPTRKALYEDQRSDSTPKIAPTQISPQRVESPKEGFHVPTQLQAPSNKFQDGHYNNMQDEFEEPDTNEDQDLDDTGDNDFVSVEGDDLGAGGSSVYEDAVYEMPVTERHEDRVDAFDYEHFFLHSAMGTYSSASRRSSTSSSDSVATTRPVTAIHTRGDSTTSARRVSYHQRNSSVDSVSTVATFATAAEEQSDDEEENEQMDQFSQQILSNQDVLMPRNATQNGLMSTRSDSAINMRRANRSPTQTSQRSGGSSPAGDLMTGLQTSKIFSILLETPSKEEPRLALNEEEKQLIYGLAASFQQVCANLQSTAGDQYERKAWRRRLDEARRILNGESSEDEPF